MTENEKSHSLYLPIATQSKNIITDECPMLGFKLMKRTGFTCCDFSLNDYLRNDMLYKKKKSDFFDQSSQQLCTFFTPHKEAAQESGVRISQMHMPYPNFVPGASKEFNDYLKEVVAPKSMEICAFFECRYIVVHGFKLAKYLGSETAEWERTEEFLDFLAPMAKAYSITICIENLYTNTGNYLIEGPCCDAKKAAERIDRMNKKYGAEVLGFCFDTGHANLIGLDFEDFITILGHRLKVLHIHDNDSIGDLHQIPFTFTRNRENIPSTDWDGFINGLRKIHFNGVLSFETSPVLAAFPEELKEDVLKLIAGIGGYFAEKIKWC